MMDIVLGIISNPERLQAPGRMGVAYMQTMLFYIRDPASMDFDLQERSWHQSPTNTDGRPHYVKSMANGPKY